MIRIGILGAAHIAPRGIITPANELLGVEVVAVAARELSRARDFAAQHSIPLALGSYGELIARDDIDLVYVPLPLLVKRLHMADGPRLAQSFVVEQGSPTWAVCGDMQMPPRWSRRHARRGSC